MTPDRMRTVDLRGNARGSNITTEMNLVPALPELAKHVNQDCADSQDMLASRSKSEVLEGNADDASTAWRRGSTETGAPQMICLDWHPRRTSNDQNLLLYAIKTKRHGAGMTCAR
eukprot:CAMPEP_0177541984 /NCGR_PEP_ID=MMETSP0369-20130122/60524_1 /TAXON_ID=447022 ORGANISM="Scrippsiella hangoei-like, Strain SHHI-4" /NCGR_SAMPLE_ID=MMETSP0369 /ASSEMBLY_ACC=CAM_ASM_000364 /LENGTH=114 /DNA_ID=CAMNT_0019025543 /DNA_START=43 /DNA_END=387 /DNA_ORIENTATION=+